MQIVIDLPEEMWEQVKDGYVPLGISKYLKNGTPQPKTGRWLSHKEYCEKHDLIPSGLVTLEWCSNCDFGIDIRESSRNHYKYCPNCGSKMEDKQ
jgi:hypothetical protein